MTARQDPHQPGIAGLGGRQDVPVLARFLLPGGGPGGPGHAGDERGLVPQLIQLLHQQGAPEPAYSTRWNARLASERSATSAARSAAASAA